ncbi:MAG: adenylyltransferase/cytidyltransferase family protein [Rhodoferax sp.]|nr:adenylyltransferase/cytidyltransferase family protein [Rhodoferax sp.]
MIRPLVFTNGVFDVLHIGHIDYLQKARRLGASLMVAINTDESVAALGKGPGRPINPLEHRMAMLRQLRCVDHVIAFTAPTPLQAIKLHRPDILVKGGDYKHADIVGAAEVESWGGMVVTLPFVHQVSSTKIIERMRA